MILNLVRIAGSKWGPDFPCMCMNEKLTIGLWWNC